MSASGPTMKTFHKRLCSALPRTAAPSPSSPLPRVRSNSASTTRSLYTASAGSFPLSFFDAPPPPSSRPGHHVVTRMPEARLEVEVQTNLPHTNGHGQHSHNSATHGPGNAGGPPPWSLALSSPHPNPSSPHHFASHHAVSFFPYPAFTAAPAYNPSFSAGGDPRPHPKRQRTRYHLDVGAYGIPKRRSHRAESDSVSGSHERSGEDLHLAVPVGEDAYFVRSNAMGVADGVGGWSRVKDPSPLRNAGPESSASALFARRLMHFCSAEIEDATPPLSSAPPSRSETRSVSPSSRRLSRSPAPRISSFASAAPRIAVHPPAKEVDELCEELEESLEELEEGLDVLLLLERAYERTLRAHVVPARPPSPSHIMRTSPTNIPTPPDSATPLSSGKTAQISPALVVPVADAAADECAPLMAGSSTALLAVLDHRVSPSGGAPGAQSPAPAAEAADGQPATAETGATLRIAHLGDSMGMVVRGDAIVWRSEEMWSSFNTPLQLGPRSPTRPADARVASVPVQADDILILASDGLSDNLWDEEVVDEVVRFRRAFLRDHAPVREPDAKDGSTAAAATPSTSVLGRRTMAGMLSEALCSRARRVSERGRGGARAHCAKPAMGAIPEAGMEAGAGAEGEDEIPFARRAREQGRAFRGGKSDDISVVVAVISPTASMQ